MVSDYSGSESVLDVSYIPGKCSYGCKNVQKKLGHIDSNQKTQIK
ncbi:hypothetical Protein YC6258_05148 [Gynuella sunshinyii YC6258]|uniref:Uncharacterized protein n=1 Tax=Gynuella sunshinyii YC6258 TaxID=1445510 RepID=A0A0C5VV53_9GAMM|nr:hypothetical Protein YC6258_05148 [Gynuella sunshinyii YC6258]